ncbi:exported phospholipase, patatin-like [Burkholderia lata]|uniref:Exported phospholipase, patatin-like n=1 Tax=Burkholderia lata (strain ATCC 17760 / DSM 23089 / LMG 22485 / NCIMB 9086 / R18194 / 383) TaxID=482957 RepID=A0A6P3B8J6_BURL3|nr:hypothetical protein [Burkholderia lata]VWD52978.1 exported phospholipase, patatin-like [Burkholderia lata]
MNRATSMKLIAGVLLFGIWRGLVLAHLTQAPALVDATGYASSFDRHMPITTRQRLYDDGYRAVEKALVGVEYGVCV